MCSRAFETRSRPPLSRRYPRGFAFYVAFPKSSIRPLGFAHLCRSRPRGSAHSLLPSSLYLDHSRCLVLAPATLAAFPSTRAIETRSLPTSLAATHRGFAFYVASPKSSIPDRDVFYVARVPAAPFTRSYPRHFYGHVVDSRSPDPFGRIPTDQCKSIRRLPSTAYSCHSLHSAM